MFERAQTRMRERLVVVWLIQLSQSNYFTIVRVRPPSRRSVNHGTAVTNVPVTFIHSFLPRRIDDPRMHLIEDRPSFAKRNRTTRRNRFLVSTRSRFTAKKGFKVHRCRQVRPLFRRLKIDLRNYYNFDRILENSDDAKNIPLIDFLYQIRFEN